MIFLYFSAGVLIGLGLGIIYLPRLDCITQYFDKKRPLVTGVAICGSGIGTFIFAPLTEVLLEYSDWKVALIILSGICLLNCVFGCLFKPLSTQQVRIMSRAGQIIGIIGIGIGISVFSRKSVSVSVCYSYMKIGIGIGIVKSPKNRLESVSV